MRQSRLESSANEIHTFLGRLENARCAVPLLIPVSPPVGAAGVHPSIAGLLVMKPNSVASLAAEAGRVTFWTQKEAQVCVDTFE